jgi:hypothetical protein
MRPKGDRVALAQALSDGSATCRHLRNPLSVRKGCLDVMLQWCVSRVTGRWLFLTAFALFLLTSLVASPAAYAHVKWFAAYDVVCPPRPLFSVYTGTYFVMFCGIMVAVMFVTAYVDVWLIHHAHALNRLLQRVTSFFEPNVFLLLRFGVFAFLLAVSYSGNILLTPELKTDWAWVRWLQLVLAILVVHPKTAFLTAVGLCVLYGSAMYQYGWFHLLDYPIFVGVAIYLFIMSVYGDRKATLALTILRVLTGVTLLWGGMEKFAYPDWSFPLLRQRPSLSFGFDPEFFMVAAGFVEFTAAFLVITVSIAARAASALLLFIFAAAIPEFGVIDLVGHFIIIIVLIALIFSHNPVAEKIESDNRSTAANAAFCVALYFIALVAESAFFYATHWLAYGT